MEFIIALSMIITLTLIVAGIIGGIAGIIVFDKYEKRLISLFSIIVSIVISICLYSLEYRNVNIRTHYKIEPTIEIVNYEDNYGRRYKDTVYHYKPKFR